MTGKQGGVLVLVLASLVCLTSCADSDPQPSQQEEFPLSPYWGAILQTDEGLPGKALGEDSEYGDLVAECMKTEGFEYWPEPLPGDDADVASQALSPVEEARAEGYGIVPPYTEFEVPSTNGGDTSNRNEKYVAGLSESMQKAYSDTLFGTVVEDAVSSGDVDSYEFSWKDAGCDGAAKHTMESQSGSVSLESPSKTTPYDDLISEMESLGGENLDEATMTALLADWSQCLDKRGYVFFNWEEPSEHIFAKYQDLIETTQPAEVPMDEVVWLSDHFDTVPDKTTYEALRQAERDLAVADVTCQIEVDREEVETQLLRQAEEEFVEQNRVRLDEMRAWFQLNTDNSGSTSASS